MFFLLVLYEYIRLKLVNTINGEGPTIKHFFTCETSVDDLENAASASLNIVVRREALKAAQYLEKAYGIPYIYHSLHGLENTMQFIQK